MAKQCFLVTIPIEKLGSLKTPLGSLSRLLSPNTLYAVLYSSPPSPPLLFTVLIIISTAYVV